MTKSEFLKELKYKRLNTRILSEGRKVRTVIYEQDKDYIDLILVDLNCSDAAYKGLVKGDLVEFLKDKNNDIQIRVQHKNVISVAYCKEYGFNLGTSN